ncbi:hypothetical protein F4809DRAFT_26853 [Biscogniauxia mediterranea]|nr:hypothetical protein F4809DRAFT_26853 [Biscogniauxia mediterranea]
MTSYPYAPPPPPPSAAPTSYPSYNQGQPYAPTPPRGGHSSMVNSGRARGHHQGPGRSEYGSPYYQHQEYQSPSSAPYTSPQPNAYWQSASPVNHPQAHSPLPPSNYHPNYAPQGFPPQPVQGYQSQYPAQSSRPPYGSAYSQPPSEYPSQQWADQGHSYSPYGSRGGRGGFQGDRGGHKSDHPMGPPLRIGFDQRGEHSTHAGPSYGQPYPPSNHHQPAPYQQSSYNYPSTPAPPYSGSSHPHYGPNNRGHGRDGFSHSSRGGRHSHADRGEKFRHRDQRPAHGFNNQKSDSASVSASAKKKKRKTNTLGLTPGDNDSDDGIIDEEKRLEEVLAADMIVIKDMADWLAKRKANYPTKARIQEKAAAGLITEHAVADPSKTPATKVDKDQAEADRLRKRLAKVERKLEKRKRAANDEGDEMRASVESESSDDESEDEKPETLPTGKPASGFLPPPPITRADVSNHCKYYSTGGTCGKKGKCRFKHDPAMREAALQERTRNGGRMTLAQRLMLNDKENDEMEVVKTIVEMRSNGRLHDPNNPQLHSNRQANEQAAIAAVSSLPATAGAANLPHKPQEPTKPYATWYMGGGYGDHGRDLKLRELP